MTGIWFPALPSGWQDHNIAVHGTTGCWIWEHPHIEWNVARTLIEQHARVVTGARCGITATCVNPLHSDRPPARVGGGTA